MTQLAPAKGRGDPEASAGPATPGSLRRDDDAGSTQSRHALRTRAAEKGHPPSRAEWAAPSGYFLFAAASFLSCSIAGPSSFSAAASSALSGSGGWQRGSVCWIAWNIACVNGSGTQP
jgi:hypothetical protein